MLLTDDSGKNDLYLEQIRSAEKCLSNQDYDNAIMYYQKAIEADEKQEEPYIAIARIYHENLNDTNKAISILQIGYERTGSPVIQKLLLEYDPLADGTLVLDPGDDTPKKTDSEPGAVFNTQMIDTVAANTFKDYNTKYSVDATDQQLGKYTATYNQIGARIEFVNQPNADPVIDERTGVPYDTARPTLVVFKDVATVMPAAASKLSVNAVKEYGVYNLEQRTADTVVNSDYISFDLRGCRFYVAIDKEGNVLYPDGYAALVPPANTVQTDGNVTLSGKVIDVTSGNPVAGATLTFYRNSTLVSSASAPSGVYSIELEPGSYDVVVEADGYIQETFQVSVSDSSDSTVHDFGISPSLSSGQIRIVLEWGAEPRDLDSHLTGTASDGSRVSVDFINRSARSGNTVYAELDLDDQDGFGPETITVNDTNGSYHYFVYLYAGTGTIVDSGVTVKVYTSDSSAPMVFTPPSGHTGRQWDVFSIEKGEISVDDAVSN